MDRFVEDASTQYSDWKGTAAAEPAVDEPDLAVRFGIDRERWRVVGASIYYELSVHLTLYIAEVGVAPSSSGVTDVLAYSVVDDDFDLNQLAQCFDRLDIVVSDAHSGRMRVVGDFAEPPDADS
ncbi:MAG: hypothetical protein QOD92_3923 [Acidimicrobiaceae bacterium]|jgi:hypothetical protein